MTIPHSVMAVVWGLVAIAFCEMAVNFIATTRFTPLSYGRFVRTLLPPAAVSAVMYAVVRLTAAAIPGNDLLRLVARGRGGCRLLPAALGADSGWRLTESWSPSCAGS